jgi:hypothetical protein
MRFIELEGHLQTHFAGGVDVWIVTTPPAIGCGSLNIWRVGREIWTTSISIIYAEIAYQA